MPMIALSVVVLPAPLRPSSVTTSPARTSKLTPCRTWDSPYQASSPSTDSSGAGSAMACSKIGLAHQRIIGNRPIVAFRYYLSTREHRNAVREVFDDFEIVFHHQHGAARCNRSDQGADAVDILA